MRYREKIRLGIRNSNRTWAGLHGDLLVVGRDFDCIPFARDSRLDFYPRFNSIGESTLHKHSLSSCATVAHWFLFLPLSYIA